MDALIGEHNVTNNYILINYLPGIACSGSSYNEAIMKLTSNEKLILKIFTFMVVVNTITAIIIEVIQ